MAKTSNYPIDNLSIDWSHDPLTGLKFSGAAVQTFIKKELGKIAKAAYFDASDYTMYWFASEEDKDAFVADTSLRSLILYSTQLSFSSDLYRIALVNNNSSTQLNVATNEDSVPLSVSYDVQTKTMTESSWRSTGKGVFISTFVDVGATGQYEVMTERLFMPAEQTFTVDVKNSLVIGVNRIRILFESEDDSSLTASITYTINLTEMFIEPLNNEWYKPIIEGGDSANYKLGGFRIVGAVSKTLHIDIYSGSSRLLQFEKLIGTTVYDRVPYYYTESEGLDLSTLETGVYVVAAYLTSGTLTSQAVTYNIMYIESEDQNDAQLLCINNVEQLAYNYTTAKLFEYCIYNKGSAYGSLEATVRLLNGTATASLTQVPLEDVTTSEAHSFEFPLEWLTEETLNLNVQVTMEYGNEQVASVRVDNSATFPPTYGYDFYLNAPSRANTNTNKTKIVNFVDGIEHTPTWENMTWVNNIDGWTQDETGRSCLLIPARSKVTLPYSAYRILDGENITIEMCYRVSNVSDYTENVITICDDPSIPGFRGIRIKPTNITVHSSEDTSATNDLIRGVNVMDEEVIHFVLTIYKDYVGNTGRNLVTGYINGCKNFQFEYNTGALWYTNANLIIGAERSDVALYFIRVYRSVLSDSAVAANYINSMPTIAMREDLQAIFKSVMDASMTNVDYKTVKDSNKNFFVIEMANGATVPSRKTGWDKEQKGLSTLEMHYGENPSWDWKIETVETAGQGTTSMNYYLWNLRWRIDKSSGKKVNVRYLTTRRVVGNSYVYDWGDAVLSSAVDFDGTGNHPSVKRITAKINFASSMQSHKIGATRAYTELHDAIGLENEAQHYADINDLPNPTVSVYQYPVYGFAKRGSSYDFIGLFTIGPDKNDKSTFGLDISSGIKNSLIRMEGTDHSRKMVMFNYPWNSDVQYLASNECLNIVKGANDYDNGWEVSACHGLGTDEPDDQAAINTVLETEFKPAYEVAYKNSTLIIGIPLNTYGATAEATLEYINSHISTFQSTLDFDNRMTYANYQFWIEGEYILYYYDIVNNAYVADIDLVEQNGAPPSGTVNEENEWFKAQRRARFTVEAQEYWNIPECIFHYDFILLFGAMDNFGKNTYPYKMADNDFQEIDGQEHNVGGKYAWAQDDLDSIMGIGNAGNDNMPTWMEFQDSQNGSVYFGGSTSVFWNLIHECFMEDYTNSTTNAIRPGILSMGKSILQAMSNIAGGTNVYDGATLYVKQRFWDSAQNYFPQSAYNADATLKYESAWLTNGQEVAPLSQSLGNHFSAEEYWIRKRIIYMMSMFKAGPFGSYADTSLGQIAFRPQSLQELTVTPSIDLYPAFASGQGMVSTARTRFGSDYTFIGPFGVDGQTSHYINAANLLSSLGDLKDLQLGAQYVNTLQVQGKKLIVFKIGDEVAENIITPAVYYTQEEINNAVEGDDAYGKTTEDIKTPAVTESNVTTNVPGLTFTDTKCLEVIDARNAASLTGVVDISECSRLKEAYFEGSNFSQVNLARGQRIQVLHLPELVTGISLRNLTLLTDLELPQNAGAIGLLNIENCDIDSFTLLSEAYSAENSSLQFIKIVSNRIETVNDAVLKALINISNSLDKDGNAVQYGGVSDSGGAVPTGTPFIEGTLNGTNIYANTLEAMSIVSEEAYQTNLKKALSNLFGTNLYIIYNPEEVLINFIDPVFGALAIAQWGTNGSVTAARLASVTDSQWKAFGASNLRGNTSITSLDDFKHFKGVAQLLSSSGTDNAISSMANVTSITTPGNITRIASYNMLGCSNLKTWHLGGTVSGANGTQTWSSTSAKFQYVYVTNLNHWFGSALPADAMGTENHLYLNNVEVTELVIPSTRTTLRDRCFYNFSSLTRIELPAEFTSAGENCFYGCSAMSRIDISDLEAYLRIAWDNTGHPFSGRSSGRGTLWLNGTQVTNVVIPSTHTSVKAYAFCRISVQSVTLHNGITAIGKRAFYVSGLVGDFVVPSSCTSVGEYAFNYCSGLTNLTICHSGSLPTNAVINSGNGTGTLRINGGLGESGDVSGQAYHYKKVIITGTLTNNGNRGLISSANSEVEVVRIGGNFNAGGYSQSFIIKGTSAKVKFVELMGRNTNGTSGFGSANTTFASSGCIIHLGYDAATNNQLPCTPTVACANYARVTKIYVGPGTSQAGDEAILAMYLANSAWASYSSKLATWWSYINNPDANQDYATSPFTV